MSTPSRRLCPSRWRVSGTTVTPLAAAKARGRSAVESVTMATVRSVNRSRGPSRGDDLDFDRLLNLPVPVKQQLLDRPEKEEHGQDEPGGEYRRHVKAETNGHPDCGHEPNRGRGGEAVDLVALAEDGARAKEANSRHDLGRDAGRVRGAAKRLEPQPREQAGADSH